MSTYFCFSMFLPFPIFLSNSLCLSLPLSFSLCHIPTLSLSLHYVSFTTFWYLLQWLSFNFSESISIFVFLFICFQVLLCLSLTLSHTLCVCLSLVTCNSLSLSCFNLTIFCFAFRSLRENFNLLFSYLYLKRGVVYVVVVSVRRGREISE